MIVQIFVMLRCKSVKASCRTIFERHYGAKGLHPRCCVWKQYRVVLEGGSGRWSVITADGYLDSNDDGNRRKLVSQKEETRSRTLTDVHSAQALRRPG